MATSPHSSLFTLHSIILPCGAPRRTAGFTLIELLSVMAVMVMITSVVVASGFGMRRGAVYNSVRQIPNNVLEYARQRACLDGRTTAVLFENETGSDDAPAYVASIFQAAGLVDGKEGTEIFDNFTDIATNIVTNVKNGNGSTITGRPRLFNFSNGKTFVVKQIRRLEKQHVDIDEDYAADGKANSYFYPYTAITLIGSSGDWDKGDAYGFEIADRQTLPKNFKYTGSSGCKPIDNKAFYCVFNPDGTVGGNGSGSITIQVKETVGNRKSFPDISFP